MGLGRNDRQCAIGKIHVTEALSVGMGPRAATSSLGKVLKFKCEAPGGKSISQDSIFRKLLHGYEVLSVQ